jgi:hypothetical protein
VTSLFTGDDRVQFTEGGENAPLPSAVQWQFLQQLSSIRCSEHRIAQPGNRSCRGQEDGLQLMPRILQVTPPPMLTGMRL